jgi:hypothetical protein
MNINPAAVDALSAIKGIAATIAADAVAAPQVANPVATPPANTATGVSPQVPNPIAAARAKNAATAASMTPALPTFNDAAIMFNDDDDDVAATASAVAAPAQGNATNVAAAAATVAAPAHGNAANVAAAVAAPAQGNATNVAAAAIAAPAQGNATNVATAAAAVAAPAQGNATNVATAAVAAPAQGNATTCILSYNIEGISNLEPHVQQHATAFYNLFVPLFEAAGDTFKIMDRVKYYRIMGALQRARDGKLLSSLCHEFRQIHNWNKVFAVVVAGGSTILVSHPKEMIGEENIDAELVRRVSYLERVISDLLVGHGQDHSKGRSLYFCVAEIVSNIPREVCKHFTDTCPRCIERQKRMCPTAGL